MARFGGIPVSTGAKPRFAGVPVDAAAKPVPGAEMLPGGGQPVGSFGAPGGDNAPFVPPENNYTPSSVPWLDPVNAFGTSLAENIPFIGKGLSELGNSVDAGFASAVEGKPVTADQRGAITEGEQQQFPAASVSGAIAGNVLPLAPLAATKMGQAALGLTGSLPQRVLLGGLSGGAISGADALTDGKTLPEAADAAMWGGALGGAGGAAAPVVDDMLSWLGRSLGLKGKEAADNLSRPARQTITRALSSNDALGANGAAAIRAAGPRGMLVDASPAARDVLDTALQRSGPGALPARRAVDARAADANTTINTALDDALGSPMGVKASETANRVGTAEARDAAYKKAYSKPIDYASEPGMAVEQLLQRVPKGIIGLANRLMQVEGHQSKQILAKIADDGSITFFRQPDVQQVDYITRALNQAAKSGEGQGALGGQTDIGRGYGNLARDIRDQARAAVPEYDVALQTAASPIQLREALRYGEGLLAPNLARDEAREVLEAMTKPQLAGVRQGIRSRIDDVLANVRQVISDPNLDAREATKALQDLSTRAAREKITMALDDPAAANKLFAELAKATKALELKAGVATNSRTFGRQAVDEAVKDAINGGVFNAGLRGDPLQASKKAWQSVTGRTPAGEANMADKVYSEIANALTLSGPQAEDLLTSLAVRANRPKPNGMYLPGLAQAGKDYGFPVMARP